MSLTSNKYQLSVALDFGTSYSGFGFSTGIKESDKIHIMQSYPGATTPYCKAVTALAIDKNNKKNIIWGDNAPIAYYSQFKDGNIESNDLKIHLFKNFKMNLWDNNSEYTWDINHQIQMKTTDLVTIYLNCFWNHIQKQFQSYGIQQKISNEDISWCLSIPAIWEDKQKDLMKKCAFAAGMLDSPNPSEQHFQFVLEPEAAAAECLHEMKVQSTQSLQEGTTILVVDGGGGTIDVTWFDNFFF